MDAEGKAIDGLIDIGDENSNGIREVSYVLHQGGFYSMSVKVNGEEILQSPFPIEIGGSTSTSRFFSFFPFFPYPFLISLLFFYLILFLPLFFVPILFLFVLRPGSPSFSS